MSIQLLQGADKTIRISRTEGLEKLDHVPANVYKFNVIEGMSGVQYQLIYRGDVLSVPDQKYGEHAEMLRAVVDEYDRLAPSIGVICVGLKGSGKSLLCNDISNQFIRMGLPVVLIEDKIDLTHLRNLLSVTGPCVLYFDEYGKHYNDSDSRNRLLALFSDPPYNGYVFLVTANNSSELNDFILNRPGRFAYRFEINHVSSVALNDFFVKNNIPKERIIWLLSMRKQLSFDILLTIRKALRESSSFVEFRKALRWLNVPQPQSIILSFHSNIELKGECSDNSITPVSSIVEGNEIIIRYVNDGVDYEDRLQIIDDNGYLTIDDRKIVQTERLIFSIDIDTIYCYDSMLSGDTPIVKMVQKTGHFKSLPATVEDTSVEAAPSNVAIGISQRSEWFKSSSEGIRPTPIEYNFSKI